MKRRGYHLSVFQRVRDEILAADPEVQAAFGELLFLLVRDPYPNDQNNALPLKDEAILPNAFVAPFNEALLTYQVTVDTPVIKCVSVTWLPPTTDSPPTS